METEFGIYHPASTPLPRTAVGSSGPPGLLARSNLFAIALVMSECRLVSGVDPGHRADRRGSGGRRIRARSAFCFSDQRITYTRRQARLTRTRHPTPSWPSRFAPDETRTAVPLLHPVDLVEMSAYSYCGALNRIQVQFGNCFNLPPSQSLTGLIVSTASRPAHGLVGAPIHRPQLDIRGMEDGKHRCV
jgi:hypothetical protein